MARHNRFAEAVELSGTVDPASLVTAGKVFAGQEQGPAAAGEGAPTDSEPTAATGEALVGGKADWTFRLGGEGPVVEPRNGRFNGAFRESDLQAWKACAKANGISLTRLVERCVNDVVLNGRVVP